MAKNIDLKNIDLGNLYKLGKPAQLVISAVTAILVIVLAYFALFSSQLENLNTLSEKEDSLKEAYLQKNIQAGNKDAIITELKQINSSFTVLLKQLPTDAEIPNLIEELHQAASGNGLRMDSITPLPVVNTESVQRLPYSISLTGNYGQISRFIRDVGKLSRIVTLDDITLNADATGKIITLKATATTYKALSAAEQAAANKTKDEEGKK